ncbi:MAG TPA: hypothetical protein VM557_14080 [Thermoanaerobaculia bacterium]|nr:hypothetical protein [Thermoanaerobaculia bacterium]
MRFPWSYAKRVVAGAIFGLYMALLLYYLNPQLEISAGRLLGVTLVYAVLCGLIFGSMLWGLRSLRVRVFPPAVEESYRPHGFGFVVAAAFISALVYWSHLALLRIYLPIGAVRILSKATTVIGATATLLLVLWLVERTAGRRTSRALFACGVILIVVSSFFLYQRRERYRSEVEKPVVATVAIGQEQRLAFVEIADLPHDWVVTIRGEGALPFFTRSAGEGFFTRIEPFRTTSPKAIQASLNTGKLPFRHGVTGRFAYQTPLNPPGEPYLLVPMGVGFKGWGLIPPVDRISAQLPAGRSLAFWTIWDRLGFPVVVHASESIGGRAASKRSNIAASSEVAGGNDSLPPELNEIDFPPRDRIGMALRQDRARIAAAIRNGSAVLQVVELESVAVAVREMGMDGNQLPPPHTPEGAILRSILSEIDESLADLQSAKRGDLLVIVSPSGAKPPVLPGTLPSLIQAIAETQDPGASDGFFMMVGPPVAEGGGISTSAQIADVVPTLLFGGGLPVARDLDGRIITEAFSESWLRERPVSIIETYESERLIVRRPATDSGAPHNFPQDSVPRS